MRHTTANTELLPLSEHLLPYGFMPRGHVSDYVRRHGAEEEVQRLSEIEGRWQAIQSEVQKLVEKEALQKVADSSTTQPLPSDFAAPLAELKGTSGFARAFSKVNTTFEQVDLDTLVAPQRAINLAYSTRLATELPETLDLKELVSICLPSGGSNSTIRHAEIAPNTHTFTSANQDLRFLGCFRKQLTKDDVSYASLGGIPAAAIIAFVGYGIGCVNAYKHRDRLVLVNGFHRLYALRLRGVTQVPMVLQHVSDPDLQLPDRIVDHSRNYVFKSQRPVLFKDFLHNPFTLKIQVKRFLRSVTLNLSSTQYDVPI